MTCELFEMQISLYTKQGVKSILGNSYYNEWPEVENTQNRATLEQIRNFTLGMNVGKHSPSPNADNKLPWTVETEG